MVALLAQVGDAAAELRCCVSDRGAGGLVVAVPAARAELVLTAPTAAGRGGGGASWSTAALTMIGSAVGTGEVATSLSVSPSRPNRDPSDSNNEKTGRERAVCRAGGCGMGTLKAVTEVSMHARIARAKGAISVDAMEERASRFRPRCDLRDVLAELAGAAA